MSALWGGQRRSQQRRPRGRPVRRCKAKEVKGVEVPELSGRHGNAAKRSTRTRTVGPRSLTI